MSSPGADSAASHVSLRLDQVRFVGVEVCALTCSYQTNVKVREGLIEGFRYVHANRSC